MAATHLLDTSIYSQPLKRKPAQGILDRWNAVGDSSFAISVITEAEIRYGLDWNGSPARIAEFESALLPRLPILSVDSAVASAYGAIRGDLRRRGMPVGEMDILIGATARAHGLILATLNAKDFTRMEGVTVEDWSA